jgi:hypothetical protein
MERLLNRSLLESFIRYNPSSRLKSKFSKTEDAKDLLKVEIGMLCILYVIFYAV